MEDLAQSAVEPPAVAGAGEAPVPLPDPSEARGTPLEGAPLEEEHPGAQEPPPSRVFVGRAPETALQDVLAALEERATYIVARAAAAVEDLERRLEALLALPHHLARAWSAGAVQAAEAAARREGPSTPAQTPSALRGHPSPVGQQGKAPGADILRRVVALDRHGASVPRIARELALTVEEVEMYLARAALERERAAPQR